MSSTIPASSTCDRSARRVRSRGGMVEGVEAISAIRQPQFIIVNNDCVEGMKEIQARSVDLVVTSPPYNIGKNYGVYHDERVDYLEWCKQWGGEIKRLLKADGSFFLNIGSPLANPLLALEVAEVMSGMFRLQNIIHWIKSISIDHGDSVDTFGHFKPINSPRFLNDCHEFVFHFTICGETHLDRLAVGVPYADKTNIKRWAHTGGQDRRCRGNTWFIPYKTIRERAKDRPHPATFPTELASRCIRLHGRKSSVVLDPFLGIGHSALAARDCSSLVCKFIGFDIDEAYLKVASQVLGCEYCAAYPRLAASCP